jgi:hypothetical protein
MTGANYSARPTPSCQRSVTALPSARRLLGRVLINAQIAVPGFFWSAPNGLHQWFTLSKYTFSAHWPT